MAEFNDARQYAAATQRNREFILEILKDIIPPYDNILEIASGTGEHAVFFAPQFSPRQWIPSDADSQMHSSILSWREYSQVENLQLPLNIDARDSFWEVEKSDIPISAIVNINMIHISPWDACLGLMAGAQRILPTNGILYLYGPFMEGEKTAPSNLDFHNWLLSKNPEWGIRDLDKVISTAADGNLNLEKIIPMPANNLSLVFKKGKDK